MMAEHEMLDNTMSDGELLAAVKETLRHIAESSSESGEQGV